MGKRLKLRALRLSPLLPVASNRLKAGGRFAALRALEASAAGLGL